VPWKLTDRSQLLPSLIQRHHELAVLQKGIQPLFWSQSLCIRQECLSGFLGQFRFHGESQLPRGDE
jgi:hypothetical protein